MIPAVYEVRRHSFYHEISIFSKVEPPFIVFYLIKRFNIRFFLIEEYLFYILIIFVFVFFKFVFKYSRFNLMGGRLCFQL